LRFAGSGGLASIQEDEATGFTNHIKALFSDFAKDRRLDL